MGLDAGDFAQALKIGLNRLAKRVDAYYNLLSSNRIPAKFTSPHSHVRIHTSIRAFTRHKCGT